MPQYTVLPSDVQTDEAADAFRTLFGKEELQNVLDTDEEEEELEPGDTTEDGKRIWSEEEWQAAADQTDQMSPEEFEDWDTARTEGRVK